MARWTDTYTLRGEADVRDLDKAVDALRDTAKATDEVGDMADRMADDVRRGSQELAGIDGSAGKAKRGVKDFGAESQKTGGILGRLGDVAGDVFKTLAGFAGLGAIGVGALFGGALADITAIDGALNKYQAQTGTRDFQMDGIEGAVESLYTQGLGEDFNDIAGSMATIRSLTGNWDTDFLQAMTGDALILRDVFDYDVTESVRAANQLMTQFGTEGGAAFDMITRASQFAGDPAGDLLDTVNEYSSTFEDMGFSAEEMMSILASGRMGGAWNYDVVADSIREMNIRLQDGTSDLALWSMGLDGVKRQWQDGSITAADFFDKVIAGLNEIDDPLERQQKGVEIFGTKWEDLGDEMFLSLETGSDLFTNMEDATARAGEVMQRGLQPAYQKFIRTLRVGVANALSPYVEAFIRQLIPGMERFGAWLQTVGLPWLVAFIGQIAAGVQSVIDFGTRFGVFDALAVVLGTVADYAGQFVGFIAGLSPESVIALAGALAWIAGPAVIGAVMTGLSGMVGLLTSSALVNPLLLIALSGIAAYETNFGGMRNAVDGMVAAFKEGDLATAFTELGNALLAIPKGIANELGQAIFGWEPGEMQERLNKWTEIPGMIGEIATKLGELALAEISDFAGSFTSSVVDPVRNGINDVTAFIFGGGGRAVSTSLKAAFEGIPTLVTNALADVGGKFKSALYDPVAGTIGDIVAALMGGGGRDAATSLKAAVGAVPTLVVNALTGLGDQVKSALYDPFVGVVADIVSVFIGQDKADSLEATLVNLPGKIAEWAVNVAAAGGEMAQGFVDAFAAVLSSLAGIVIGAINAAIPDDIGMDIPRDPFGFLDKAGVPDRWEIDLPDDPIPIPSRDLGGKVKAGSAYWIGKEAQPEIYIPDRDGVMVPKGRYTVGAGAGGGDMIFNGDLYFSGVQNIKDLREQLERETRRVNKHGGRA